MSFDHDPTEINALAILGADPDVRELASLERLRLAAKVAQAERNMSEKTRARRWKKDSGAVITHGELIGELNKAQKIAIDVAPLPVRERARVMARRGMSLNAIIEALGLHGIDAPSRSTLYKMVRNIMAERGANCVVCGAVFRPRGRSAVCESIECRSPICPCGCGKRGTPKGSKQASWRGKPWQCKPSSGRMTLAGHKQRLAARTSEQRSESARKGKAKQSPESRSAAARKANASKTPEQRRVEGLKAAATRKARRAGQTEPPP
ncbi:MAG: hypothetical protein IPF92_21405 [Myxococcales bacterium]|nr:hypothetical protein [Myxococcales bacterium]HQY59813.1 hypothetical protein [Polyangiaceae bacterium]